MPRRQPRLTVVDTETGEPLDDYRVEVRRERLEVSFVRVFEQAQRDLLLSHPDLSATALRLMVYLQTRLTWRTNEVPTPTETAASLGLHRPQVSRAYAELARADFLIRRGVRYYVNPLMAFKGSDTAYHAACRNLLMGRHDPLPAIPPVETVDAQARTWIAQHEATHIVREATTPYLSNE